MARDRLQGGLTWLLRHPAPHPLPAACNRRLIGKGLPLLCGALLRLRLVLGADAGTFLITGLAAHAIAIGLLLLFGHQLLP